MTLKAVLFDFNGVIINDEPLHDKLIDQLLLEENLRPKPGEARQFCLGRNDRTCLTELFANRGRVLTDAALQNLIERKSRLYQRELENIEVLPSYPGLEDLMFNLRAAKLSLAIVSGALRSEIDLVLARMQLGEYFSVIVAGDEDIPSKPEPDGFLMAVDRLNEQTPELNLKPQECLVIEDTFAGIQAAKQAGMRVVGVANTYPFHMLHRRANWAVDYLSELELDRIQELFNQETVATNS
jgi:HAD superfamily hydrolase (TIGR01509 family)